MTVSDLTCQLTLLVVDRVPFSLIIGRFAVKDMKDSQTFDKEIAILEEMEELSLCRFGKAVN